jgi:hypothetical protein
MIKIDLKSGFFQLRVHPKYQPFYGVYYKGQRLELTRLPMGHPLAPALMQKFSIPVARYLHQRFNITMVAYLDDWLLFSEDPIPVNNILQALATLGITVNQHKSVLQPTTALTYLGLQINSHHDHHTNAEMHPASIGPYLSGPKCNQNGSST